MRRALFWLLASGVLILAVVFGIKWWALSEFATSGEYYSAAWGANGTLCTVHVTVRSTAGRPMAGREVDVVNSSGTQSAVTDKNGEAVIRSSECDLVGLLIEDEAIIYSLGPREIRKVWNLSHGMDVWVTEKARPAKLIKTSRASDLEH